MRIAVDCSHHRIPGGVRSYIENLLGALARREPEHDYVLCYRGRGPDGPLPLPAPARCSVARVRVPRRLLDFLENRLGAPSVERWTGAIDVFHGTHFSLPVSRGARLILSVHDVAYLRDPSLYASRSTNEYGYRYLLRHSLRRAHLVLASSSSTRRDLGELGGFDAERIWVVPFGVDPRLRPLSPEEREPAVRRAGIGRPYVLYPVGSMDLRKNLSRAIRAFASAFPRPGDRPALVLTSAGASPPGLVEEARRLGIAGDIFVRRVAYPDEMMALMGGALWGMYLSLYEGFGLPPLEAMACGLPMLVSNVTSMPEVAGRAAVQVDPRDVDAIAAAMRTLHEDAPLREDLRRRGIERAASPAFSWERAARQTLAAYRGDRAEFDFIPAPGE